MTEGPTPGVRERRRTPRLRVQEVNCLDNNRPGQPIPVRDVSLDGFAVECERFFEPGALHLFSLLPARGTAVTSLVQVVRSERMRGRSRIVTGFRFSMVSAHTREEVQNFVRALAAEAGHEALR